MDTFPGMQFEPASLHKYLYCQNRPVDRWDPSGEMSLIELVAVTSLVTGLILDIVYVYYANYLNRITTDVIWNGKMQYYGASWWIGVILFWCNLTAEPHFGLNGKGNYCIYTGGLSLSLPPAVDWNSSVTIRSPGIYGPNPWLLEGTFIYSSIVSILGLGIQRGFTMGIGESFDLFLADLAIEVSIASVFIGYSNLTSGNWG